MRPQADCAVWQAQGRNHMIQAKRMVLLILLAGGLMVAGGLRADPPVVVGEPVTAVGPTVDVDGDAGAEAAPPGAPAAITAEVEPQAFLPMVLKPHTFSAEARAVLEIVNEERAQAGCGPVVLQEQLTAAAQGHSEDMALNDYFDHTSKDGRSPWQRIQATGYQYSAAGENIAAGYSTPESVMDGWMNSDGHRKNILNCNFTEMGLGYYYLANDLGEYRYRHYWTQVFARPR